MQCSVFQYLLGLLKSEEFSRSTVSYNCFELYGSVCHAIGNHNIHKNPNVSICFSSIAIWLFRYFSAGVKYLQESYIWADGNCVSTFWWRHIRGITGITTLEVTFCLGYCLCPLFSTWIRPPFVCKRKEQNEMKEELFDSHVITIYFDFVLFYPFQLLVSVLSQALTEKGLCLDFWDSVCTQYFFQFTSYVVYGQWLSCYTALD